MHTAKHIRHKLNGSIAHQFGTTAEKVGEALLENVKQGFTDASVTTSRYTKRYPLAALGVSFATGAILSIWLLHR